MVGMSDVVGAMEALEEAARAVVAKPNLTAPVAPQLSARIPPKRQYYAERRCPSAGSTQGR